jgi:hypothetical protein
MATVAVAAAVVRQLLVQLAVQVPQVLVVLVVLVVTE